MARFRDYKLLTAVLAILVAGPLLWLSVWAQRQSQADISAAASWTVGNIDVHIDRAVVLLDELAGLEVRGCEAPQLELLRQGLLSAGPVKELAVIGAQGQVLCTDRGDSVAPREVVSSAATSNPNIMLDVMRLGANDERALRVRRLASAVQPSLAAIIPIDILLPQLAPDGSRFSGHARMTLADGALIGSVGPDREAEGLAASRARSDRHSVIVTVATPRGDAFVAYGGLPRVAMVAAGLLVLVVVGAALVFPGRGRRGPYYDIERAIGAGEFVPYYQPVVDIKSGAIVGAEVLVRWRKRDGSLVAPATFVPFLEPTDLILDMTRSIMRQVCDEVGTLLEHRPNMYLAFNIAPRHFRGDLLIDDIGSIFVGGPISTSQIVLELTERYEIENLADTRNLIASLQGIGCRVAIDDVGTGHNGLSYILKLGVDIIKIDKMFVDAIGTESHSQAIVETLVDLARNLRMQIVAEGVETFEQVIYLRDHGISSAQGFVFAPPLPGQAFVQLIEALDPPLPRAPRATITGEAPLRPGLPQRAVA